MQAEREKIGGLPLRKEIEPPPVRLNKIWIAFRFVSEFNLFVILGLRHQIWSGPSELEIQRKVIRLNWIL